MRYKSIILFLIVANVIAALVFVYSTKDNDQDDEADAALQISRTDEENRLIDAQEEADEFNNNNNTIVDPRTNPNWEAVNEPRLIGTTIYEYIAALEGEEAINTDELPESLTDSELTIATRANKDQERMRYFLTDDQIDEYLSEKQASTYTKWRDANFNDQGAPTSEFEVLL